VVIHGTFILGLPVETKKKPRCISDSTGYSVTMTTKAATANGLSKQERKYLTAIAECIQEMKHIRKGMKKTDAEIRRLEASTRRKLDQTWEILRDVQNNSLSWFNNLLFC
jgi:hypothetical protein